MGLVDTWNKLIVGPGSYKKLRPRLASCSPQTYLSPSIGLLKSLRFRELYFMPLSLALTSLGLSPTHTQHGQHLRDVRRLAFGRTICVHV